MNPSFSYPDPGLFGSLSEKTIGSARQIQYGMPERSSVPTAPYLKCSTMSAGFGGGLPPHCIVDTESVTRKRASAAFIARGIVIVLVRLKADTTFPPVL